MTSPHDEMRSYLKQLVHRYLNTDSMNKQIADMAQWDVPDRREALEHGAYFFKCVTYGLWRIVLVELSMLLSSSENRSLTDWLEKAKVHSGPIKPTRHSAAYPHGDREPVPNEEYCRIIDGQLQQIKAQKDVIDRIRTHRDKTIAHLDKLYFDNPEAIFNDYPLSMTDVRSLMDLVRGILKSHYSYLFGSDLDMAVYSVHTLDAVLQHVQGFIRVQEDPDLLKKGFSPAKYLSDVYEGTG